MPRFLEKERVESGSDDDLSSMLKWTTITPWTGQGWLPAFPPCQSFGVGTFLLFARAADYVVTTERGTMCEYLAGSMHSSSLLSEELKRELKSAARRAGYHLQLASEVPPSIQVEIHRYAGNDSSSMLFNITSGEGPHRNCIEETLNKELDLRSQRPFEDVHFFRLVCKLFDLAKPDRAIIIYTEGASVGWFPLGRQRTTLEKFLRRLYEYHDRRDYDVRGVYEVA